MKRFADKVFDKLNDRDPDLLAEIIAEIEQEEDKSISIDQYMAMNPNIDPHEQYDDEDDLPPIGLAGENTWLP